MLFHKEFLDFVRPERIVARFMNSEKLLYWASLSPPPFPYLDSFNNRYRDASLDTEKE